jgi:hypothetical protein
MDNEGGSTQTIRLTRPLQSHSHLLDRLARHAPELKKGKTGTRQNWEATSGEG